MRIPHIAQIAILTTIAIIGVILLIAMAGKEKETPSNAPIKGELNLQEAEQATETIEQTQETTENNDDVNAGQISLQCYGFEKVNTEISEDTISITGSVFDNTDKVKLVCSNNEYEFDVVDKAFSITTEYEKCGVGTATLKYECNGETKETKVDIPSQMRTIKTQRIKLSGTEQSNFNSGETKAHMPEFSTITLALAVIGSGLVLAFFRKK